MVVISNSLLLYGVRLNVISSPRKYEVYALSEF